MTKIFSNPGDDMAPSIDKMSVARFFKERAGKIETVGAVRAVIYQDKHPTLAEERDLAERLRLLPLLDLNGTERILDVGCGAGRWTADLVKRSWYYHGIDFSEELVDYARSAHKESDTLRFSVASADKYSLEALGELSLFDRVLCCGVLIYLNDQDVERAFNCMAAVSSLKAKIILREPVGVEKRLTIKEHFSDELEQNYNAIYRTRGELDSIISKTLLPAGFCMVEQGAVYSAELSNRKETVQHFMLLERS